MTAPATVLAILIVICFAFYFWVTREAEDESDQCVYDMRDASNHNANMDVHKEELMTLDWTEYEERILDEVEEYLARPTKETWVRIQTALKQSVASWIVRDEDYKRVYNAVNTMAETIRDDTPYLLWDVIVLARATYLAGIESKKKKR